MKCDFSGYVTQYNVKCSDGVTIKPGSFKELDGKRVPLLWDHRRETPENVLGHVVLEHRDKGMYGYAYLNNSPNASLSKDLILHGDIKSFSIYANRLIRRGSDIVHGVIREVSLVLSGANEGAFIDYISIQHGDETDSDVSEAIVYVGGDILHSSDEEDQIEHKEDNEENEVSDTKTKDNEETVQDVLDSLSDKQKQAVEFVISQLIDDDESEEDSKEESVKHTAADETEKENKKEEDDEEETAVQHDNLNEGDSVMTRNVFDRSPETPETGKNFISHNDLEEIVSQAKKLGSLKEAFIAHADTYGIDNIDVLFPDAKSLTNTPELIKRDTSWVGEVMRAVRKSPMARVKTILADLTADEARARGYVKGNLKVEEVFNLLARTTSPTTIYKKQKLDRDDVVDIVDLDVIAWLKAEMRLMLDEELARAILIGDGRLVTSPDKIKDPAGETDGIGIRSILHDHQLYAETVNVPGMADDPDVLVDTVVRARKSWKGSGVPTFYSKIDVVADLLTAKDSLGRRLYATESELAGAMRVSRIVEVEVMEEHEDLIGILVNLADYTLGANKGGEVSFFDDFDIDYNQYKYLYETRLSGALTKPKSAVIFKAADSPETP